MPLQPQSVRMLEMGLIVSSPSALICTFSYRCHCVKRIEMFGSPQGVWFVDPCISWQPRVAALLSATDAWDRLKRSHFGLLIIYVVAWPVGQMY
jgi:dolichyl-phosphate-mannose--protein O-mannosyl transferase